MAVKSLQILSASVGEGDDSTDRNICSLCLTQFAKYTCPKCNVRYCSLSCYKSLKHAQCSEAFYRDCFMTELKEKKGSAEEKRQMVDMLKRFEADTNISNGDGDEGEEEEEPLDERLAGLNLDDPAEVWERLNEGEKREFQGLVASGKMGHLLPPHSPWWEGPLVSPVGASSTIPALLVNLPPLHSLVKEGGVSPLVRYSVLNVLYGYACVVRLYHGDHRELCLEASQTLLDISRCLSVSSVSFPVLSDALHSARQAALESSADFSTTVLKDVSCILSHPKSHDCHVTNALSDIHQVLSLARQKVKGGEERGGGGVAKRLWLAKKKVFFLTVWTCEHKDVLRALSKLVDLECDTLSEEFLAQSEAKGDLNLPECRHFLDTTAPKLIEELN